MNTANVVDTFRELHPTLRSFTFKRGRNYASRIDRVLISRDIMPRVSSVTHKAGIGSDHTHGPTVTLRKCARVKKGSETWRMNNTAMHSTELVADLNLLICNMRDHLVNIRDPIKTWLMVKKAIKGHLRRHGREMADRKRNQKNTLEFNWKA